MNWSRKELKKSAKKTIKKNYIQVFIACLIVAIVSGGYNSSNVNTELKQSELESKLNTPSIVDSTLDILENAGVNEIVEDEMDITDKIEEKFKIKNATEGAIATIINNSGASKSFLVGILNTVNNIVFGSRFLESSIMTIATILLIGFWLFVQNILIVGEQRFHLEDKYYNETNIDRILFVYRIRKTRHIAYIMFCRYIFNALWYLTIIGGFIKHYSYAMIPSIIAENPNISRKDAFTLSKNMMKGNKWAAFKLDMSFIFWHILSLFTFGLVRYFYLNPMLGATKAELYFVLRENAIKTNMPLSEYLNDKYLVAPPQEGMTDYPTELFTIKEIGREDWLKLDYDRDYSVKSYILIFFSIAAIGWLWEVFLNLLKDGTFVNRGTMIGPWLPIYGSGSLLMLILFKKIRDKPIILFPSIMAMCGVLEYFTSYFLERIFHTTWWNYSNVFFNINGRICLEGLLFFAVGGFLIIYFIAPMIDEILKNIPNKIINILCIVLIGLFLTDLGFSFNNPNKGEGISAPVEKSSIIRNIYV